MIAELSADRQGLLQILDRVRQLVGPNMAYGHQIQGGCLAVTVSELVPEFNNAPEIPKGSFESASLALEQRSHFQGIGLTA